MASTNYPAQKYRKPINPFIGRGDTSERLYQLEEKAHSTFKTAAEELGKVLGQDKKFFWTETLPEALYSFLDGWDHCAGEQACIAFLEKRGFTITAKE